MQIENLNESIDLANLRLKLRGGLEFHLQEHGDTCCWVIHDETTSNYFQVGIPEYAFISVHDGNTTLQQAVQETARRLGEDALTIREAIRISHWLLESGLANAVNQHGALISDAGELLDQTEQHARQQRVSKLNPLFIRLPLGCPQSLFNMIAPIAGWIASRAFFVVWMATVVYAGMCLFQNPQSLANATRGLLAADTWGWMVVTMVGLKLVHELSHGIFCHRFGGNVRETGIVFILFIPMPYMDVTSCWSFPNKWKRIAVASAGMYIEVFLAAIATVVWSFCSDPVLKAHLFNVMLLGSLTTVFFNANFLMRFDGYYILSDLLEIPNLYQRGQQFVNSLGRRFLLGMTGGGQNGSDTSDSRRIRWIVRSFGWAAWLWRILICVSLTVLATALFYGFGLALAFAGVLLWLGTPTWQFVSRWMDPSSDGKPNFTWISLVTAPSVACLVGAAFYLPCPWQVTAPAVVEFDSPSMVRADAAGFVRSVCVVEGQRVHRGEPLVLLENRELALRIQELQLEREQSLIRSRSYYQERKIAAYQSENGSREAIDKQIAELKQKQDSLTLVAPTDGIVMGPELETLSGQFIAPGTTVMQIVDPSRKRIKASVSQDDFDTFVAHESHPTTFVPQFGTRRYAGTLRRVDPTATSYTDIRLTSYAGGSLAVRPPQQMPNAKPDTEESLELTTARFSGDVELVAARDELRVGTVGSIRLNQFGGTIAEHVVSSTRRWLASLSR